MRSIFFLSFKITTFIWTIGLIQFDLIISIILQFSWLQCWSLMYTLCAHFRGISSFRNTVDRSKPICLHSFWGRVLLLSAMIWLAYVFRDNLCKLGCLSNLSCAWYVAITCLLVDTCLTRDTVLVTEDIRHLADNMTGSDILSAKCHLFITEYDLRNIIHCFILLKHVSFRGARLTATNFELLSSLIFLISWSRNSQTSFT